MINFVRFLFFSDQVCYVDKLHYLIAPQRRFYWTYVDVPKILRETLRNDIQDRYDRAIMDLSMELGQVNSKISFTCDVWTSKAVRILVTVLDFCDRAAHLCCAPQLFQNNDYCPTHCFRMRQSHAHFWNNGFERSSIRRRDHGVIVLTSWTSSHRNKLVSSTNNNTKLTLFRFSFLLPSFLSPLPFKSTASLHRSDGTLREWQLAVG